MTVFQIHVTTAPMEQARLAQYQALCAKWAVKPLLIVLDCGHWVEQPMFTLKAESNAWDEALAQAEVVSAIFAAEGFPTVRLKGEIGDLAAEGLYYEWHCLTAVQDLAQARVFCAAYEGHLSRNALAEGLRYVTVRQQERAALEQAVARLKAHWSPALGEAVKEKFECCIYDSRKALDEGWA